jgi:outer membrane receptor for ferrienterochelin and colicin
MAVKLGLDRRSVTVAFTRWIVAALLLIQPIAAAGSDADLADASIEQLLDIEVSVASYRAKPIREQPGVVTVITEEEIKRTGARDLIDVLNLVPGFYFAGDVVELVGISTRGIWANEGKVLLLIDGLELNENTYGSLQFNNHISADQIRQIEIIRGPGSAMYGSSAGLAVIKIATKGSEIDGGWVSSDFAYNKKRFNSKHDMVFGKEFEDWKFSAAASFKQGRRSNQNLHDYYGNEYDMTEDSEFKNWPSYYNLGLNVKGLDIRFIYDRYRYEFRDYYGIVPESNQREEVFNSLLLSVKYDWEVNDKFSIHPKFSYKNYPTWKSHVEDQPNFDGWRWNVEGKRFAGELVGVYDFTEYLPEDFELLFTAGGEYYKDRGDAHKQSGKPKEIHFDGSDHVSYDNWAGFFQSELDTPYANVTVGGRYQHQDFAGGEFVPRVAITKAWKKAHIKALFGQAYRTPNIEHIRYSAGSGSSLNTEKSSAYETEVGYRFNDWAFWVANGFYAAVKRPIYYRPDGFYVNGNTVSSYGMETELRLMPSWESMKLDAKLGYGFYISDKRGIDAWKSDDPDRASGLPSHKLTYDITYTFKEKWSINCNGFFATARRAWADPDGDWVATPKGFGSEMITNLYFMYDHGPVSVGVGISDLFNEKQIYAPAYDNWSGGIPAMSREYFFKGSFKF